MQCQVTSEKQNQASSVLPGLQKYFKFSPMTSSFGNGK